MDGGIFYINPSKTGKYDTYYNGDEAIPDPTFRLAYSEPGDAISHFTAIRMRAHGVGNLKLKVYSLDDVNSLDLLQLPLNSSSSTLSTRICNFTSQRASFEGKTTVMGEQMRVNQIIIYSRDVATSYPE